MRTIYLHLVVGMRLRQQGGISAPVNMSSLLKWISISRYHFEAQQGHLVLLPGRGVMVANNLAAVWSSDYRTSLDKQPLTTKVQHANTFGRSMAHLSPC